MTRETTAGRRTPLGVTPEADGVNVSVYSANAEKIEFCLFSPDGETEVERIPLEYREGDFWHAHIPGVVVGDRYGLRVHGPHDPYTGQRFNENKLLIDPYAKQLDRPLRWHPEMTGHSTTPDDDLIENSVDSAPVMPKCLVTDATAFDWEDDAPPAHPSAESVIYEAHVKGLTQLHPDVPEAVRGSYLGVCSDPMIEHFTSLGVTAVELLPVQAFIDDRHLVELGLTNYWGYQPCAYFAPEPRYARGDAVAEFKQMVKTLHRAGLEVILDVVYNHTGEGNEHGPTLSLRGLDNRSFYRLTDGGRHYVNDTGTGNALDVSSGATMRLVMDSLRYWVQEMHVDGFRFDLAVTVGRGPNGFDPEGSFFDAIRQDPVLAAVKLIAEPWDVGWEGYQLGHFPYPFHEWNDRFRDGVRRAWRGDDFARADLGSRLLGSAGLFDHSSRPATTSVNILTTHDGFTLTDVVSYVDKHNEANGEENRDGHSENVSDSFGVEGPTDDADIIARRKRRKRAMLATLMVSQGVPMLLGGDEFGNSQSGNNNAYCQDNEIGWLDWRDVDHELLDFTRRAVAVRRDQPLLRQRTFMHGRKRESDGRPDVTWYRADGQIPTEENWRDPQWRTVCAHVLGAAGDPLGQRRTDEVFIILNTGAAIDVTLPAPELGQQWTLVLDSDLGADDGPTVVADAVLRAPEQTVLVLAASAADPAS